MLNYPNKIEKDFEDDVCLRLEQHAGYRKREAKDIRHDLACDVDELFAFLEDTQQQALDEIALAWYGVRRTADGSMPGRLAKEIWHQVQAKGKLSALRNGVDVAKVHLRLFYTDPGNDDNPELSAKYRSNRLTYARQVPADRKRSQILDVATFVNGLAYSAIELKFIEAGQSREDAEAQWRNDRDPSVPLFSWNRGAIAYFAVDEQDASMTTRIEGPDTFFMPYDRGIGDGVAKTTGNPIPEPGEPFATHYIFDDVIALDAISRCVSEYCQIQYKENGNDLLVFPRWHQRELIEKMDAEVEADPLVRHDFLVEHFAGSGKTWEMVWALYRMARKVHPDENRPLFAKVVCVSNRRVLDGQLRDALDACEHDEGYFAYADSTAALEKALSGNARIVATTVQKFLELMRRGTFSAKPGEQYFVAIDEIQSGYEGAGMESLLAALSPDVRSRAVAGNIDEAVQEEIARTIALSGKQANISCMVCSATPTDNTYRTFGVKGPDGQFGPYHRYTMQQAIDEGYIVNPLQNVVVCEPRFKAEKTVSADPDYVPHDVEMVVGGKVSCSPAAIREKAKAMSRYFTSIVLDSCLGGKEKAIVMAPSREAVVLYYFAWQRFASLPENRGKIRALCAFTGTVTIDGQEYTESSLNGFSDSETAEVFDGDDYNILIVDRKFLVGYDQPKLCAAFVDKRLSGISMVQATTRVDRSIKGIDKIPYLFFFANSCDDVVNAYSPYFSTREVEVADKAALRTAYTEMMGFGLIASPEVKTFFRVALAAQKTGEHISARPYLHTTITAYNAVDKNRQSAFLKSLRKFDSTYKLVNMTDKITDPAIIEVRATVLALIKILGTKTKHESGNATKREREEIDSSVSVRMGNYTAAAQEVTFKANESASDSVEPTVTAGSGSLQRQQQRRRLSNILKWINARYALDDEIAGPIDDIIMKLVDEPDDETRNSAAANSYVEFASVLWPRKVGKALLSVYNMDDDTGLVEVVNDIFCHEEKLAELANIYAGAAYDIARAAKK